MKWRMKRRRNLRRWTSLGVKRKMMMVRAKSTVKAPVKERFSMFTRKKTLLIMVYQQAFSYSQKLLGGEINEQIRIGNCLFF